MTFGFVGLNMPLGFHEATGSRSRQIADWYDANFGIAGRDMAAPSTVRHSASLGQTAGPYTCRRTE